MLPISRNKGIKNLLENEKSSYDTVIKLVSLIKGVDQI